MITAPQALARLKDGNRRFAAGGSDAAPALDPARRRALAEGQEPFAVILGCSDSRVPAELIFGQGLGDLFVIRVAGNIVAPSLIGSVEFAASRFGTRLVVVLGHTQCGAVTATVEALRNPGADVTPGLRSIVDFIRPAVAPLLSGPHASDTAAVIARAVRANIAAAAGQLRHGSAMLERLIRSDGLLVVGAEYDLRTGNVDFFDGVS